MDDAPRPFDWKLGLGLFILWIGITTVCYLLSLPPIVSRVFAGVIGLGWLAYGLSLMRRRRVAWRDPKSGRFSR